MKKTYITPDMEVVDIQISQHLMAGSIAGSNVYTDTDAGADVVGLGHEDDFDFSQVEF